MTSFINLNLTQGYVKFDLLSPVLCPYCNAAPCACCQACGAHADLCPAPCETCDVHPCAPCGDCDLCPCKCCTECDAYPCECCTECDAYPCECCSTCEGPPGECECCSICNRYMPVYNCNCCHDCNSRECECSFGDYCSSCDSRDCECGHRAYDCDRNDDDDDDDDDTSGIVHSYNYTPDLNFMRTSTEDENLFLGVEIEVPSDNPRAIASRLAESYGEQESVLYCKEDGSIRGVEIVSHPMTHKYWRESFDAAAMFRDIQLREHLRGVTPFPIGYGLHIHVSRAGFKSEAHVLRWLLLIYRNQRNVETIARRSSEQITDGNDWATFSDSSLCVAKAKNRDRYGDPYPGSRYCAVNATNRETFELRMFRSTWRLSEFRAALDLAHASVTYTRGLAASDVLRGDALAWPAFLTWCATRSEYSYLTAFTAKAA